MPQQPVEAGELQTFLGHHFLQGEREEVAHQGNRLTGGQPQSLEVQDARPLGELQAVRHFERGGHDFVGQQPCGRRLPGLRQVVVETAETHWPPHAHRNHERADAVPANHQTSVRQDGDRATHRWPAHSQLPSQLDFILQVRSGGQRARTDGRLQALGQLVIERHRASPIERGVRQSPLSPHSLKSCGLSGAETSCHDNLTSIL